MYRRSRPLRRGSVGETGTRARLAFFDFYHPVGEVEGLRCVWCFERRVHALKNRQVQEARGREVVEEMVEQLRPPEQAPKPEPDRGRWLQVKRTWNNRGL
jgi:hypothetical protein